ncbi:MAG: hypothetical protein KDA05_01555 [Phycisphaerales bacterium]|nr:hypothetical protein [Phycisphaerales bacterium]MCB9840193.1 hypothetical protein [Phycisphaeraceae bacterium]
MALVALIGILGACAADLPPAIPESAALHPRPERVVADWDDIEAAAWAAAPRVEATIIHAEFLDPLTQRVELVTSRDEVAVLTATRAAPPPDAPPGSPADRGENTPIDLRFRIGRFGDASREWAFLTDLVDRLEALRGVGAAPIRWTDR